VYWKKPSLVFIDLRAYDVFLPNYFYCTTLDFRFANLSSSFWWEVSWLSLFIIISIISCFLFSRDCVANDTLHLAVASVSDIILSVSCLALLLWAEVQRCCQSDPGCCAQFGSRSYGGLGKIEPFTSLIALRVFRYVWGRLVRRMFRRSVEVKLDDVSSDQYTATTRVRRKHLADEYNYRNSVTRTMTQRSLLERDDEEHKLQQKARERFEHKIGTAVELWKTALGLYPEVVEKYGEFSAELLQAMLGIAIVDEKPRQQSSSTAYGDKVHVSPKTDNEGTITLPAPAFFPPTSPVSPTEDRTFVSPGAQANAHESPSPSTPLLLSEKYAGLAPETQEVILAGKVGKPVRKRQSAVDNVSASEAAGGFFGGPPGKSDHRRSNTAEFELDRVQNTEERDESSVMFSYPNSRLIRSMRRCERRLPPMLNEWTAVDVVLTKYELVYFHATSFDDTGKLSDDPPASNRDQGSADALRKKRHSVLDAIVATKGGKGLRLRDVAVGRKVVGHLELMDMTSVKVERFPPMPYKDGESGGVHVESDEYWKKSHDGEANRDEERKDVWKHVMEDRLKLNSAQGSLYLRFISDLEEWTSRKHDHDDEIVKNDALHWCQTIVRLCGVEQLQQKLPNFGQEGSAELLDFIDFASRDNDDADMNKKIHRRIKSRVNLAQLGEVMKGHAHAPGTGHSRKPSSGSPAIAPPKRGSMDIPVGDQDKDATLSIRRRRNSQVSFALDDEAEKDRGSDVELGLAVSEKSYT